MLTASEKSRIIEERKEKWRKRNMRISRRRNGAIRWEGNTKVMSEGVEFPMTIKSLRSAADNGEVTLLPALMGGAG